MPKFRVFIATTTLKTGYIDVKADNETQAEILVEDQYPDGAIESGPDDPILRVVHVERRPDAL